MNIATWMLAGAIVGWLCYTVVALNEGRGQAVSVVIGAMGGVVGGSIVAPMLTAPAPGAFSLAGLSFAAAVAAALLAIGHLLSRRWGV